MDNPIASIRQRHRMTVVEFAMALGISPATVASAEAGELLRPRKLILSLALLTGQDPEELQAAYSEWRSVRAADYRARLAAL